MVSHLFLAATLLISLHLLLLCSSRSALSPLLSKSLGGGDGMEMQGVVHANGAVAGNGR